MTENELEAIRLIITDCDGVLTDGGLYYGPDGEALKKYNAKDGMAFAIIRDIKSLDVIILTGENTEMTRKRAAKFGMTIYQGIHDKLDILTQIKESKKLEWSQIAFIGDDLNDLECMQQVGIAACPADAVPEIKSVSNYVCTKAGGSGCFREFADLIRTHHQ